MPGALNGIRVLELGRGVGSAYAGKLLADLGADVLKLQPNDIQETPAFSESERGLDGALDVFFNGSKRRGRLPRSVQELRALVDDSDIVITADGPRRLEEIGIVPHEVAERGKLLLSITNFGLREAGPPKHLPDFLLAALGGFVLLTGMPDKPPARNPVALPQFQAALTGVIGTLAALLRRDIDGLGDVIDVSLYEAVVFLMEREDIVYTHQHTLWTRDARHKIVHPFTILPCRDGHVCLAVAAPVMFQALCELMEHPELAADQEILLNTLGNADLIDSYLLPWLAAHDKREIAALCQERRIPATPVLNFEELLHDEHLRVRRFFQTFAREEGTAQAPGPPYRLSETPVTTTASANDVGR